MDADSAKQLILDLYSGFLARLPREEELEHWVLVALSEVSAEKIVRLFASSTEHQSHLRVRPFFKNGHFYSPVVDPDAVRDYVGRHGAPSKAIMGIEVSGESMMSFWQANLDFIKETPFVDEKDERNRYFYNNTSYPYGDAIITRAMIRHHRPKRIIEIGSGFSSACMLDAVDHSNYSLQSMICIDPQADRLRTLLRQGDQERVRILERPVQEIPLDLFKLLEPGDFLFIDSTHVLKTGSDVHYELFHILPSLRSGVLIHFHDIHYPFEYPKEWIFQHNFSWNEIYALRAFLMFNEGFSVQFWNGYFGYHFQNEIQKSCPVFLKNPGGAIWLKKEINESPALIPKSNYAESVPDVNYDLPAPDDAAISSAIRAAEPIRLVVWDLDETFWKGTLSEGGIQEYVQEHHDIVIELARRGIMSSICSKNDSNVVQELLSEKGIAQYFIFPSVSWDPKGPRLAALIEAVQLRPSTVLFIDDNPSNRGEAQTYVPGIQIADEKIISGMLVDPRFRGKDDRKLSRLSQYKLLETRAGAMESAVDGKEAFLKDSDIRVFIDYDLEKLENLDRAIELINRTNQLNYTKIRLPEDLEVARRELLNELRRFHRQSGLIRVVDKYGDYGYVGFFMLENDVFNFDETRPAFRGLRHFCFSCRTLGILIERWLYDYLGRPRLKVVGEVLTDLSAPVDVNWVHLVSDISGTGEYIAPAAPEIRLYGGCEAHAISVYLAPHAQKIEAFGNFSANGIFFRINSAALALSAFARRGSEFDDEARLLGLPISLISGDLFADAPLGAAFIFSSALDIQRRPHYKHIHHEWEFVFEIAGFEDLDLVNATASELQEKLVRLRAMNHFDAAGISHIEKVIRHIRANYQSLPGISDRRRVASLGGLIERLPLGSKFVLLLDHHRRRLSDGTVRADPPTEAYNLLAQSVLNEVPYAVCASFSDVIDSDDQIQIGGNHYDRSVYVKIAQKVLQLLRDTPPKIAGDRRALV